MKCKLYTIQITLEFNTSEIEKLDSPKRGDILMNEAIKIFPILKDYSCEDYEFEDSDGEKTTYLIWFSPKI